jgi:hypothetical protein
LGILFKNGIIPIEISSEVIGVKLTFWSLIGTQLIKIHSLTGMFFSIILSVWLWQNTPNKTLPLIYFIYLLVFTSLLIITLISAVMVAIKNQNPIPKIENIIKTSNGDIICLLQSSNLFSNGISVSFYYTNDQNFEQLVCIGTVINIQENGLIQAKIENYLDVHQDIIEKIKNNDNQIIKKIKVKPSIPADI